MKSKRWGRGFKISILILLFLLAAYFFLHSSLFNIGRIEVEGNEKVSGEEILALAGIDSGENIFAANEKIIAKSIEIHPMVKSAEITRQLPGTIKIGIKEREVWAIVPYDGMFLYIDNEGVCIDKLSNVTISKYPLITFDQLPQRINLGQAINPTAITTINQVWKGITNGYRDSISEFHYQNQDKSLVIYTVNGTEIKFGDKERLAEKVAQFSQVLKVENDLIKEGKETLEYVDLRFKGQPVVKTGN